jgi:hypothetical protein
MYLLLSARSQLSWIMRDQEATLLSQIQAIPRPDFFHRSHLLPTLIFSLDSPLSSTHQSIRTLQQHGYYQQRLFLGPASWEPNPNNGFEAASVAP